MRQKRSSLCGSGSFSSVTLHDRYKTQTPTTEASKNALSWAAMERRRAPRPRPGQDRGGASKVRGAEASASVDLFEVEQDDQVRPQRVQRPPVVARDLVLDLHQPARSSGLEAEASSERHALEVGAGAIGDHLDPRVGEGEHGIARAAGEVGRVVDPTELDTGREEALGQGQVADAESADLVPDERLVDVAGGKVRARGEHPALEATVHPGFDLEVLLTAEAERERDVVGHGILFFG